MRRRAKKATNSSGWPLLDPLATETPPFLANALDYIEKKCLQVEGLFRISALQADVEKTVKQWKKGKVVLLGDEHTVAGSVKLFFREFDDPLLTYELYDAFLEAAEQRAEDKRVRFVSKAITQLPPVNRTLLKALLELLQKVAAHSSANKMTPANLAIVFAPSIIRAENESQMSAMMSMRATTDLVEHLIVECGKKYFVGGAVAAPPPVEAAPETEEKFDRVLRRGTMRLGTRMIMETLETMEEEEEPAPEVPELPDELVADMLHQHLQQQASQQASQQPSIAASPVSMSPAPIATPPPPAAAPTPLPAATTGAPEKKMPAGAVKMMLGRPPPPQVALPEPPQAVAAAVAEETPERISRASGKTLPVKTAAAAAAAKAAPAPAMPELPPELPALPPGEGPQPAVPGEAKKLPAGAVKMPFGVGAKMGGLKKAPPLQKSLSEEGGTSAAVSVVVDATLPAPKKAVQVRVGAKAAPPPVAEGEEGTAAAAVKQPVKAKAAPPPAPPPVAEGEEGTAVKHPLPVKAKATPPPLVPPAGGEGDEESKPVKMLGVPVAKRHSKSPRPKSFDGGKAVPPASGAGGGRLAAPAKEPAQPSSPRPEGGPKSPRAGGPRPQSGPGQTKAAAAKGPSATDTIRHSTTTAAARKAVAERMAEVLSASANKKTVPELLAMMAAGDLAGVNAYLNSLSKAERDETRAQLRQMTDAK